MCWKPDSHRYEEDEDSAGERKSSTKGAEGRLKAVTRIVS